MKHTRPFLAGDTLQLLRGLDPDKDQTYFLASVPGAALQHCLFPVGDLRKQQVRALAAEAGLVPPGKRSSAGICFIGKNHIVVCQRPLSVDTTWPLKQLVAASLVVGLSQQLTSCGPRQRANMPSVADHRLGLPYWCSKVPRRCWDRHSPSSCALLCAGRRDFGDFMSQYVEPVPGQFVDVDTGRVLGPCSNTLAVTWGQRSAIGGMPDR